MAKIVTLGEIMLRLSPEGNDRFIQSESLRIIPGGGEALSPQCHATAVLDALSVTCETGPWPPQ